MELNSPEWLKNGNNALLAHLDAQQARHTLRCLTEDLFGFSPSKAPAQLSTDALNTWNTAIQRIIQGEPLAYVTGIQWFYDLPFFVSPEVLIPRPETEELVAWALSLLRNHKAPNILDVGTGSGCIAVSLAKALPQANVTALDLSPGALAITQKNAAKHEVRLSTLQVDFLSWVPEPEQSWDLIISNPPYIPPSERAVMSAQVIQHEPALALFTPEEDPLVFYRQLATLANNHLQKQGWLLVELNEFRAEATQSCWKELVLKNIELRQDLSGANRMLAAQIS